MAKEIKLPKVSVEVAKLYEKAGLGTIANELPFVARVQYRLRTEYNVLAVVLPVGCLYNYTTASIICNPIANPASFVTSIISTQEYDTYDEAMEACLKEILTSIIDGK